MHNGPFTPAPSAVTCCGQPRQVVSLTRDRVDGSEVELVRCSSCGLSAWLLDGVEVDRQRALGALSVAYGPATPRPPGRQARRAAAPGPAAAAVETAPTGADLKQLLAGWTVFGS